jgi:uncharacterized protein (TIGR03118 family)
LLHALRTGNLAPRCPPNKGEKSTGSRKFRDVLQIRHVAIAGRILMAFHRSASAWLALGAALAAVALPVAAAPSFAVTNLVSDDPVSIPAKVNDTQLQNAWGVTYSPTSPFWISSNGMGLSPIYKVDPTTQATVKQGLTVTIPPAGSGTPTGQVFNSNAANAFGGDLFLFVSEDGTIAGWRGALGSTAETLQTPDTANVYKGVAFATTAAGNSYLYAANFRAGTIDVLKGNGGPDLTGNFTDPNLPSGFAPFNIRLLDGSLYVSYAQQDADKHDEIDGLGLGYVDQYDLQGNLLGRVASADTLDAPWGLAIAPASFGAWAGALLVGNFGNGHIGAFDITKHSFLGEVTGADGQPLAIDGLWAITPGNGNGAGSAALLYATAGPDGESKSLFAVLTPVPEPETGALLLSGLALMAGLLRRRRRARD